MAKDTSKTGNGAAAAEGSADSATEKAKREHGKNKSPIEVTNAETAGQYVVDWLQRVQAAAAGSEGTKTLKMYNQHGFVSEDPYDAPLSAIIKMSAVLANVLATKYPDALQLVGEIYSSAGSTAATERVRSEVAAAARLVGVTPEDWATRQTIDGRTFKSLDDLVKHLATRPVPRKAAVKG